MIFNNLPFRPLTKTFIGFEDLFSQLDEVLRSVDNGANWPPYNVSKTDNIYTLELAVAGFTKNDIDIRLQDNTLVITGNKEGKPDESKFIYHGIAYRSFTRRFRVSETVEVKSAKLVDGILTLTLENKIPEEKKAKYIEIE